MKVSRVGGELGLVTIFWDVRRAGICTRIEFLVSGDEYSQSDKDQSRDRMHAPAERDLGSCHEAVLREPGSNCASKTDNRYWRLRKPLHHSRQRFRKIVVYHHGGEQYEKHKCGLINPFFDLQADVAANDALDEKEQDHTTIEYRNGQEIENAEIEADC